MERESTGIPDLDGLIEGGVPRPFCLSVCSEIGVGKRVLVWQIMAGFLKNGCQGLYICLDSPAQEIQNHLKTLKIDIDSYEKKGNLFFLDLFSARANKIKIEEEVNLDMLQYDPNEIIREIMPRLTKLERGFIIIDTISTLIMTMNAKDAYRLVRSIKMLSRTQNLIGIGISHTDPVDPRELEMMRSNADGCIRLQEQELWIDRFDRTDFSNEKLVVLRTKSGSLILRRKRRRKR